MMHKTLSEHEAFWSARYASAGKDYLFGIEPSRFILSHRHYFKAGGTALSVADGEGRNSVWLAQQSMDVTALEISPVALEKAAALAVANNARVNFQQADALTLDWSRDVGRYDHVLGVFIQFAAPVERMRLFVGMQQAVKPGGLLFLHGYTPKQLEYGTGGPSALEKLYTAAMLKAAFPGPAWEVIESHEYEEELREGTAHCGRSALIDFVVQRRNT